MGISVLKNARIIDCTGADPCENGAVIIEGERIKEVVSGPPGRLPAVAAGRDPAGNGERPGLWSGP